MGALATVTDLAHIVAKLKMYPYFDVSNYVLMCLMAREDAATPAGQGPGSTGFSRRHPFSSWASSMLLCFASVILANAFVGDSPSAPFLNQRDLITATVVWYLVNYSPFDLVYKVTKFLPVYVFISCLKEVQRVHKVQHGVSHATKTFPTAYAVVVAVGVLKGAGYYYMRTLERLVRGNWIPTKNEFLHPSLATKVSALASIAFILDHEGLIHLPHHILNLAIVAVFVLLRLAYVLVGIHNPFLVVENVVCAVFFGGIVDSLRRATSPAKQETSGGASGGGTGNRSPASTAAKAKDD